MTGQTSRRIMADGRRLHLQHGPIDIIAEAFGSEEDVIGAYRQGIAVFETILQTLVRDLDQLKQPVDLGQVPNLQGIAFDMWQSASLFAKGRFVTPMAAVAGAVADQLKEAMLVGRELDKLYVNNGGDISVFLRPGATFVSGIVNDQSAPSIDAVTTLKHGDEVGGVATSGWRGRSMSPGIADAVTVLAANAAHADVAATLIAGDVWVESSAIMQAPALSRRDDTDLGDMMITTDVGKLSEGDINVALERGLTTAKRFQEQGIIKGAYLALQGETRILSLPTRKQGRNVA